MQKLILFAILWGGFWDTVFFESSGFYSAPLILAAIFLYYSPLVIKFLNIAIAGFLAFFTMLVWSARTAGFTGVSYSFILHMAFYVALSLLLASLIYALDKKKTIWPI